MERKLGAAELRVGVGGCRETQREPQRGRGVFQVLFQEMFCLEWLAKLQV